MSIFDDKKAKVSGGNGDHPDATPFEFSAPGVAVEGTVIEVTNDIPGDYGSYRLVFLQTDKGKVSFLAGSVLLEKIAKANPKPGDQLGVRFDGLEKSKKNPSRSYKNWTVAHIPAAGSSLFND